MFLIGYCITYMIYTGFAAGITSLLAARSDTHNLQWHSALQLDLPLHALCNSDAHRYLKEDLGGQRFSTDDEVKEDVTRFLKGLAAEFYNMGIKNVGASKRRLCGKIA
ncbi:hypothetical protein J6590_006496 [Homalodisca vitripennis]|nr:hypothetical protein J6590_006496 [Homalodisca vitripennis]